MSATDFLDIVIHIVFISLGVLAIVDYLRRRNGTRRDVALMFGILAIPFLLQLIARIKEEEVSAGAQMLSITALVLEPYLLLRLVRYLRSLPAYMMRLALYSLIATVITGIVVGQRIPLITTLVSQGYLIGFNLYAMIGFARGVVRSTGVQRQRLRFAAAGSGLFALIFVATLLANAIQLQQDAALLLLEALAGACVITYYIGFTPPRWLRRVWQLAELRTYLLQTRQNTAPARFGVEESLLQLCQATERAVGSLAAAVVQWDESVAQWRIRSETGLSLRSSTSLNDLGSLNQVWTERRSRVMYASDSLHTDDHKLLGLVGADALIVVPIAADDRTWGLLLVFLQYRSLFMEDDVSLVELLAQESTILLDNYRLIGELQTYSEQLERKVEERTVALRQSETLYRTIARNFPNGSIVLFDTDLRFIVADGTELALLGLSSQQLEGKTIWEVFPQTYCDEVLEPAYRGILAGNSAPSEIFYEDRIRLLFGVPVKDENNKTFAGVLITQDITERRTVEDEVRRLNQELEQRVVERTAELEAVNKELEAFSYSVSHDLRAPLRAVDGFSQALLEDYHDALDDIGRDFLRRVRTACQRMGQLIDDLIELSRLTRTEMKRADIDLSEMVREIVADFEAKEPERIVELSIQNGIKGRGDARLIRVALQNLIGNAWKFTTKKTQARIEFGCTNEGDATEYYVRDNGAGFDMIYAAKLFGAFQRLHDADEFAGTGIGLATVQRVIRRHNGAIRAEAAVNEGATFYFTLEAGNDA